MTYSVMLPGPKPPSSFCEALKYPKACRIAGASGPRGAPCAGGIVRRVNTQQVSTAVLITNLFIAFIFSLHLYYLDVSSATVPTPDTVQAPEDKLLDISRKRYRGQRYLPGKSHGCRF